MSLLEELNEEQRLAVQSISGPLLVLAGAGSGKTRVVTYRIIYLLQNGVFANRILGLTFTNKAAQEMRQRVHAKTMSDVLISTFHSLGVRILRESINVLEGYRRDFTIYDEEDANRLLTSCFEDLSPAEAKTQLKAVRGYISKAKNSLLKGDFSEDSYLFSVFERYQEKLKECNAVDFDDLLFLPVKILQEFHHLKEMYQQRWHYLMIDEYQDTNNAQYEMIKCLLGKEHNLCVVGDPDQSIYAWRGANIHNIMNFKDDYPEAKIIRLEQNYRSRSNILEAANALIQHNEKRYEKNLWSERGIGEKIKYFRAFNERDEAEFVARQLKLTHMRGVPWNRMVVFYRNHALSRAFEDVFYLKHIPYMIMGGISFYQRREVKDILAFLRMVRSNSDFVAFARTINLPKRGVGGATIEKMRLGTKEEKLPILDFCHALLNHAPLKTEIKLPKKQREGLQQYLNIVQTLRAIENEQQPLQRLVQMAIEMTNYMDYLREEMETYQERKENIEALIAKAAEWQSSAENGSLASFLEELSLKSALDEEGDGIKERVHLMTIHNGKGLEYDTVFMVGLEEELFPHPEAEYSQNKLEEERRLCYVGMTRAQEGLYLSSVSERFLWGTFRTRMPSRFIQEIPMQYLEKIRR